MGIKIGIDLGTTFSAVAMMDPQKGHPVIVPNTLGEKITPSVVQLTDDGRWIVGAEAKDAFEAGETGCASAFKRGMARDDVFCTLGGKAYTAVDLSAILLRHLKAETEAVTGQTVEEAVITVPAYFYDKERRATLKAAAMAGLKVRQLINEPTAAAMNYGAAHWRENACVMVYDLGGGTFDVTLVRMKAGGQMESLKTVGNQNLGGKDWDGRLNQLIAQKIEEDTGLSAADDVALRREIAQVAEAVKRQLTGRLTAPVKLFVPGYGMYTTTVTREEFDDRTADLRSMTGTLCESILTELGIGWKDITDILLVGGSTRMPQISAYLKQISGHTPLCQVHPDEAVALGAAVQVHQPLPEYSVIAVKGGAAEQQQRQTALVREITHSRVGQETALSSAMQVRQSDVVAHAMGVIAVSEDGQRYINQTIVPANQTIPVKCAEAFRFYTTPNGDNEMEIYMLQGTKPPTEAEVIGKYVVSGIRHDPRDNPTLMRIQYSYDASGLVHVQVRRGSEERDLPVREETVDADMSRFGRPVERPVQTVPEPLSIMMAIDVSYSMNGDPLRDAKNAMCHFVEQFAGYGGEVRFGVIAVSDTSMVVQRLTTDPRQCRAGIGRIEVSMTGICNGGHPFDDIARELGGCAGRRVAIVLADGMWDHQKQAISAAKRCHQMGIDVAGIGFGSADKAFLQAISSGEIEAMLVRQSELTQGFGKIAQAIGGGGTAGRQGREKSSDRAVTWLATGER